MKAARIHYIISMFNADQGLQFDLYRPYRAVRTGPPGYQYIDRPLPGGTAKIDHRQSISAVGGQLREKSIVDDRLREKKGRRRRRTGNEERRRRGEEERSTSHRPRPHAVAACRSPVGDFSPAQGDGTSPRAG
ncbi:hypothetical protein GW17_00038418 [Ensete ventricosum]|nr:hypothetical protein GW17_00038418 [Ensete ventricosum]